MVVAVNGLCSSLNGRDGGVILLHDKCQEPAEVSHLADAVNFVYT